MTAIEAERAALAALQVWAKRKTSPMTTRLAMVQAERELEAAARIVRETMGR